ALYRNNGDGTFTDVTKEAGLYNEEGRGMGVTLADFDNDGRPDLYVTNDAMANELFRNLGGGKFKEEALEREAAFGESGQGVSSMGPTFGDVDHDGWLDLYIPDMDYGCLLMNRRDRFEDRTTATGLAVICGQYIGWGGILFDYDNDGWMDLFISNGNAHNEYPEDPVLVRNDGQGRFIDVARQSGEYFQKKYVGRGASFADFDNDGDLDLLVVNLNSAPKLLRNDGGNRNHWLMVAPKVAGGKRDAIGARVTVTAGPLVQFLDACPTRSYLSQGDPRLHFGLGTATKVDRVEVRWPDGTKTELKDVPANKVLTIVQPAK
ncbi:MAG: CRTAC1 family protein, partial [Thermoguttaceae bacterium]|nr:CRTAC1 family protein [Thermoguttaceae bacterium]